jgi:hypothetical protein
MRRSVVLAALLLAAPHLEAQAPPARAPKKPELRIGESPEPPSSLATRLRGDLLSANAAARAGLAKLKLLPVPTPVSKEQKLKQAALAAGLESPCDRALFRVEGSAADFSLQPGQLILLNGCFRGLPAAEVRIEGPSLPGGALLLQIQDRGETYFYGTVPDVDHVPDQPVSVVVRFLADGFRTAPKNGTFRAKRQSWEAAANPAACNALLVSGNGTSMGLPDEMGCAGQWGHGPAGIDIWSPKNLPAGYRITKFWWTAIASWNGFDHPNAAPTDVRWSDDGTTVLVSHRDHAWYGASRVRIEGPAGLRPF